MSLAFKAMKQEEMVLIRTVYFEGVGGRSPWDVLAVSERTFYRTRRRVFENIYYIGSEEIDREARKTKKWQNNGRILADNTEKSIV